MCFLLGDGQAKCHLRSHSLNTFPPSAWNRKYCLNTIQHQHKLNYQVINKSTSMSQPDTYEWTSSWLKELYKLQPSAHLSQTWHCATLLWWWMHINFNTSYANTLRHAPPYVTFLSQRGSLWLSGSGWRKAGEGEIWQIHTICTKSTN